MQNYRNKITGTVSLMFLLWLILHGCSGKTMVLKYYVIEIPQPEDTLTVSGDVPITGYSCEVRETEISPAYSGNEIALRSGSHELTYYAYHQWAVRPAEAVTDILEEQLEGQGIFRTIKQRFWGVNPDYSLISRIHNLEVVRMDDAFSARLNIEFVLLDNPVEKIRVTHTADRQVALRRKNINLFAMEISRMLEEEFEILAGKIRSTLANGSQQAITPVQPH